MPKDLYNHQASKLSDLDLRMVRAIPSGGNWQDIPLDIPSKRLEQIRKSGGRTTYYGRLRYDFPSYTISTYFNRPGNGCYIHPEQDRVISIREAARLQSFKDTFVFYGSRTSQYKQVGNAVPPLLARAVAELIEPHLKSKTFIDLFAGAGGMSEGFLMQGFQLLGAIEIEEHYFETFIKNHCGSKKEKYFIQGDITEKNNKENLISLKDKHKVGVIVGGPPCQGFSYAGWRDPNDMRNKLFLDFVDIVRTVKPEFFVLENVPGILSMRNGSAIKEITDCFTEIGYHVNAPLLLKAEHFGVPQLRRRVFVIGSLKKETVACPKLLFKSQSRREKKQPYEEVNQDKLPTVVNVREAIAGLPPLKSGEGDFKATIDFKLVSQYEKFLAGEISFKDFYKTKLRTLQ